MQLGAMNAARRPLTIAALPGHRRLPHIWLRDEILDPVTAVVPHRGGVEYWAIRRTGPLARLRPRVLMPREDAQQELRRRMKPSGSFHAYRDDGPAGPLSSG